MHEIKEIHMPKKVLIALPLGMLEQVDFIAEFEHRTRSDLIREALRRYITQFRGADQSRLRIASIGETRVATFEDATV